MLCNWFLLRCPNHIHDSEAPKGLIVVAEDFDDPLEDFKEYMG